VEEVSIINDKTEYAEAQKEVIMEQKDEEKFEKDVVSIEVEAFRANQTSLSEESTLREMASESQLLARAYSASSTTFGKQKVTVTKTISARTQSIQKIQKELVSATTAADKEKLQKQITQFTTENERDNATLVE
jgi:retron-type reverse transcriptase